jgi:hypothetical protein
MEMHERLVLARRRAEFATAADAARALGIKYATYAGHENGSSGFRAATGELYARRFKVRFEWLMRGVGPMTGADVAVFEELARLVPGAVPEAVDAAMTTLRLGQRPEGSTAPKLLPAPKPSTRRP